LTVQQELPAAAGDTAIAITERFRLWAGNSLEEYRCRSFFDKEPETVAWIESLVKDGDVMYDVGANVGVYSIYAGLQHAGAKVYAFEPLQVNFHRLCANIRLNGVGNVVPLHLALSDRNGIDSLYVSDYRLGASGSQLGAAVNDKGEAFDPLGTEYVPALRMDALGSVFGMPPPNHIKIDVDGIEMRIVQGMAGLLAADSIRSILIEVNREVTDQGSIAGHLQSLGFHADHPLNQHPRHSRQRRKGTRSDLVENVIFVRR